MLVLSRWRGGGGTGGSQSSASCSLFSNCPYFFVPFSADSHPLLRFSHYDVNDGIFTPYCNRECFGLVQKKNSVVNQTTLHSPPSLLKRHSFDTSLHSVFNCELQSYGASSQEDLPWMDFSPSYWKYWDRSKWSLISDTVNRCVHVSCYVIHVLWCKRLGKVFIFTGSNPVFFIPNTNFHLFNLVFSHIKFCFKLWRMLNGGQEMLCSFHWLDVSSNK